MRHQRNSHVAHHFRSENGYSITDLRAQIILQASSHVIDRYLTKSKFIKLFESLQPNGLNLRL